MCEMTISQKSGAISPEIRITYRPKPGILLRNDPGTSLDGRARIWESVGDDKWTSFHTKINLYEGNSKK